MSATLQTDAWVETETCDGPRHVPNSPNRETPGVLMSKIQDKYIPEFTLPYRNVLRYIKEVENNWNRLDESQRNAIRESYDKMGLSKVEHFSQNCIDEIKQSPEDLKKLLGDIFTDDQYKHLREVVRDWNRKNYMTVNYDWCGGLISFLFLVLLIILIVMIFR